MSFETGLETIGADIQKLSTVTDIRICQDRRKYKSASSSSIWEAMTRHSNRLSRLSERQRDLGEARAAEPRPAMQELAADPAVEADAGGQVVDVRLHIKRDARRFLQSLRMEGVRARNSNGVITSDYESNPIE